MRKSTDILISTRSRYILKLDRAWINLSLQGSCSVLCAPLRGEQQATVLWLAEMWRKRLIFIEWVADRNKLGSRYEIKEQIKWSIALFIVCILSENNVSCVCDIFGHRCYNTRCGDGDNAGRNRILQYCICFDYWCGCVIFRVVCCWTK